MKPLLISFSGIDGAGKSTQVEKLRRYLASAGISVRELTFWDDIALLADLRAGFSRRVLSRDATGDGRKPTTLRRDKNVQNCALLVARAVLYLLDALSLRRAVAKAQHSASVLLFDRYIYDQLAVLPMTSRLARAYARLVLKIAPRPDLSYLLDAVPEVALARKPEYPLAFMHRYRSSYLELCDLAAIGLIAPGDIEDVHLAIVDRLKNYIPSPSEARVSTAVVACD